MTLNIKQRDQLLRAVEVAQEQYSKDAITAGESRIGDSFKDQAQTCAELVSLLEQCDLVKLS